MALQRTVKSAERTLALFELFSREQQPFTVGQIAKTLRMPQPSASMLLKNLLALGYLEYESKDRTYAPSIRVALLGSWINRRFSEVGAIAARLGKLQSTVGETAFIGIQNGAAAQYVLVQRADHPDQLNVASGIYRPLTCSAMGRALLSLKSNREILTWLRRCNAEATSRQFIVNEREFLPLIAQVRAAGYAETAGDVTRGQGAIAVPFASPMGRLPLAVGIGGPIAQIRKKRKVILKSLFEFRRTFATSQEDSTESIPRDFLASRPIREPLTEALV